MANTLKSFAETKAQEACSIPSFVGINIVDIKTKVESMLSMIGRDGIFAEYTKHDIGHVDRMLSLIDTIIPEDTRQIMTQAEWLLLVLSIYFHDLGMLVTKKEYSEREKSKKYVEYRERYIDCAEAEFSLRGLDKAEKERFIYQEYVRITHGDRVYSWILNEKVDGVPYDEAVVSIVQGMVAGMQTMFKKDLALVCRSHSRDDIDNFDVYRPDQFYGQSHEEHANVFYVALIVRTADLLHISSDRTPTIEYKLISPSNPKSQDEWAKQMAVAGIQPKFKTDSEGNVDKSQIPDSFQVNAMFQTENGFFALIDYLNYARRQLQRNFQINEKVRKKYAVPHLFPWRDIDDSAIQTENFEREPLSFSIDQVKILDLLVGETLYNNHTVAIRELVQNAIDAVKVKKYEQESRREFNPEVQVSWDPETRELIVKDNGTGMNLDIIKNYLLKVGSSRYQDSEFIKKHPGYHSISRFGIGLLTCFLVADDVDILTNMNPEDKPLLLKIRNLQGKYLLKHGGGDDKLQLIGDTGTSIRLKIRTGIMDFDPREQLCDWVLFPCCGVTYSCEGTIIKVGFSSPKEMMDSLLEELGEKEQYKVATGSQSGVDIALLLKRDEYLNEWELVNVDHFLNRTKGNSMTPWGLCVEGIRINHNTPGFDGCSFIACANLYGQNAPKTTVARSSISSDSIKNLLSVLYQLLIKIADEQKVQITKDFSQTWANDEIRWFLDSMFGGGIMGHPSLLLDRDVFKEQLAKAPIILVEEGDNRQFCSFDHLKELGHFWSVESEAFSSVNRLLREMPQSEITAISVLRSLLVHDDSLKEIDVLYCDANSKGIVDEVRESMFSVSSIKVIENQRRLDMKWECTSQENKWFYQELLNRYNLRGKFGSGLYVQESEDIVFSIPKKYCAVKSRYGLFVSKNSPAANIIHEMRTRVDVKKQVDREALRLVCSYLEYVLLLERKENVELRSFESFLERNDYPIQENLTSLLPLHELAELDLENCLAYDPSRWYREL